MSVKNPKAKGNSWEREVSRMLSLWWSGGQDKFVFQRTQSSGAWSTIAGKPQSLSAQAGDITAIDGRGKPFSDKMYVETKWYKEENSIFFELLTGKKVQVLQWWVKCEREAVTLQKQPFLIVKFNNRFPFVLFTYELYDKILGMVGLPSWIKSGCIFKLNFADSVYATVVAMKFEDWLRWCTPKLFLTEWLWE